MTGSPIFSINLTNRKNPSNLNYHMSIKKSQAILKHFIDLKFSVWFTLCSENETMFCDTQNFLGRLPVKIVKTVNDRQSTPLAESLRSSLDKSGKGKEKRGKRKEERGKRKEERGKRNEERGKRKEERGKRKEEPEKSSKCHKIRFRFLSPA